jgi:hypothetical protein
MDKNSGHVYPIRMPEYKLCTQTVDNLSTFVRCVESELQLSRSNFADGRGHPHDHLYRVEAGKFLFRGQSEDWPLLPKLARLKTDEDLLDVERVMLEEFARLSLPYTKGLVNDSWDRLALAQHHGLPTRLLDWTFSALAALWFAVSPKPREDDDKRPMRDGVVWMLRPAVADFVRFPAKDSPSEPTDSAFEVADLPSTLVRTRIFLPRVVADRISAQSGVFTVHATLQDVRAPHFARLEQHPCFAKNLVKIPVLAKHFGRLRNQLHHCGINSSTIYPDLGGLCQHLEWSFTQPDGPEPTPPSAPAVRAI